MLNEASRRLEIERPPTRSGSSREETEPESKPTSAPPAGNKKKPKTDDLFADDDDDPLGIYIVLFNTNAYEAFQACLNEK